MTKLKYWLIGSLVLVVVGIAIISFVQQEKINENKKENFKEESRETEKTEDINKEVEQKNITPINTGVKLVPVVTNSSDPEIMLFDPINSQLVESEEMDITAGQQWNKNTKLKYCVRYKSNSPNHRGIALLADSSL